MSGYIGNIPVPQATQTRQSFTATASQTTFNTAGYSVGYVDVFLNGVKLAPADYTATNGSDIILAVGAASGDILEIVAYEIFQVLDQDFTGDFTVDGSTFVVDSTNNRVGVGTASPARKFEVHGTSSESNRLISVEHTGADYAFITFSDQNTTDDGSVRVGGLGNDLIAFAGGSERMRIDSSGNVGIGTSSPSSLLDINAADGVADNAFALRVQNLEATDDRSYGVYIQAGSTSVDSPLAIYDHTGANSLLWVSGNGNVGIGTSLPNSPLEVSNGTENHRVAFGTGEVYLMARNASSYITQEYIANQHVFTGYGDNSSNEAMRIDSSGNLLVGKTSLDGTASRGIELRSDGLILASKSNAQPMSIDRNGTDGDILWLGKNGTKVGSIGVTDGDNLYIASTVSNHAGLKFNNTAMGPWVNNTNSNGAMDIGTPVARFKDLYLSGTVNATSFVGDGSSLTGVGGSTTQGAVGTYTWGRPANATDYAPGDTASSLYAVGLSATTYFNTSSGWVGSGSSFRHLQSGTWRSMNGAGSDGSSGYCNLWVRIS